MGTSLVVYEDQPAWEAAHNLQYETAKKQAETCNWHQKKGRICATAFTGIMAALVWFVQLDTLGLGIIGVLSLLLFTMFVVFYGLSPMIALCCLDYLTNESTRTYLDNAVEKDREAFVFPHKYDCPTCFQDVNLAQAWVCGHCRKRHENAAENSVFLGCENKNCSSARGIPSHRAQAALQCPNCKDHIVLNPLFYKEIGSHKKELKYPGVARFLHDKEQPTLGGAPPGKLPDVGDLGTIIKAAMDKSI